jgi:tetratricopeptide (TPR) repeat protein
MNLKNLPRKMSFIVKNKVKAPLCLILAAISLLVTGCGMAPRKLPVVEVPPEVMENYLSDKPVPLHGMYAKVLTEGKNSLVLNQLQAGLAAMEFGNFELAENSFDQALLRIESVYADNEEAAKARSLWHEEGAKDFKGEPYERAMAYYYRGLLYLRKGDLENARACFKSGILQDAFVEEEQNRCDFALLIFLEGWASQRLGDTALADAAFDELKELRPDFQRPPLEHDTLILIETGTAPRKVADGVGHAELKYRRGKRITAERVLLKRGGEPFSAYPIEDIYFQARTRGGRPIDKILEGKAVFLQQGLGVGTALTDTATGVILGSTLLTKHSNAVANVGAAIGVVGGVVTIVAINAKPHADTRYWNNLPDIVHVATLQTAGETEWKAAFTTRDGAAVDIPPVNLAVLADLQGDKVFWGRSRPIIVDKNSISRR